MNHKTQFNHHHFGEVNIEYSITDSTGASLIPYPIEIKDGMPILDKVIVDEVERQLNVLSKDANHEKG